MFWGGESGRIFALLASHRSFGSRAAGGVTRAPGFPSILWVPLLGGSCEDLRQAAPGYSVHMEAKVTPGLHQSRTCLSVGARGPLTFYP